ncbi:hypothetical protein M8C13_07120 [Crossiella sp. SN42]|uniref:hypothetical protein n=1 Tax=Crossiella sp. SN42 TaxID=2944808 RepID=UPI00207CCD82|nr:hypothetical protein [Crossiella sp. SN42]MCO1575528.1 hypothetical protein [Crossiella sp. SN42]
MTTSLTEDDPARAMLAEWLSAVVSVQAQATEPGWTFCCAEDVVLRLGSWGHRSPLPEGRPRGPERYCFANAADYSRRYGIAYVEGFALMSAGVVLSHAWCLDESGIVHDPTWAYDNGLAYAGVAFSEDYVKGFRARHGKALILHDSHLDDAAVLRFGFPGRATLALGKRLSTTVR